MNNSAYFQFRWEEESEFSFLCHYELVIPLGEHDIRREIWEDGEIIGRREALVIAMNNDGATRRTGGGIPCLNRETGKLYFDRPYRDSANAIWDSEKLGNIPIKVIALDGTVILEGQDVEQNIPTIPFSSF